MSFLATWKNHEQNRFFKLINKILLFQYTEGIFLIAHYPNYRHSHKEVGIDGGELLDWFSLIKQIVSIKETEKPPNETKIV